LIQNIFLKALDNFKQGGNGSGIMEHTIKITVFLLSDNLSLRLPKNHDGSKFFIPSLKKNCMPHSK